MHASCHPFDSGFNPELQPSRSVARDLTGCDVGGGVDTGDGRCARRAAHEHGGPVSRGGHQERSRHRDEAVGADWVAIRAGRERLSHWQYVDGNGNGVRASDIGSGLDLEIAEGEFIGGLFPGVGFGLHTGVPDVDGSLSTGSDGVRIGSTGFSRWRPTALRLPEPFMSGGDEDSTPSGSWGSPAAPACCAFIREQGSGQRPDRSPGGSAAPARRTEHQPGAVSEGRSIACRIR